MRHFIFIISSALPVLCWRIGSEPHAVVIGTQLVVAGLRKNAVRSPKMDRVKVIQGLEACSFFALSSRIIISTIDSMFRIGIASRSILIRKSPSAHQSRLFCKMDIDAPLPYGDAMFCRNVYT
jgi:hypothetical protein